MNYPDVTWSGAVCLGPKICCDGLCPSSAIRVQSHIHIDHLDQFDSSKGFQQILMSKPTLQLLNSERNADLPFRNNLIGLDYGSIYENGGLKVSLFPNGHMLGSVQVLAELEGGRRIGYSGDFQWPIDEIIEVESLVVDATYGSPEMVRRYSQGDCEEQFLRLVGQLLADGTVYIFANRGVLHRAIQLLYDNVNCPLVGSERLIKEIRVFRDFGYPMGEIVSDESNEGKEAIKDRRIIRFYGYGDMKPRDMEGRNVIKLTAYFSRQNNPITEYSSRAFGVALSDHADFEGTLEYIKSTGAKLVITDNTRGGKAYDLANAIVERLGIEARPSSNIRSRNFC